MWDLANGRAPVVLLLLWCASAKELRQRPKKSSLLLFPHLCVWGTVVVSFFLLDPSISWLTLELDTAHSTVTTQQQQQQQQQQARTDATPRSVIMSSSSSMFATLQHLLSKEYGERIGALNATDRSELLLPTEILLHTVLPIVLSVAATLYLLHVLFYTCCADRLLTYSDINPIRPGQKRKLCYQLTNGCMNLGLGVVGLYYQCNYVVTPPNNDDITTIIAGHTDFLLFAAAQLGYQLYSIPLGFMVGESLPMLIHHVTVICVSVMSACCHNGFRYYTPFFYGLIEWSSVPLSLMNGMRDHAIGVNTQFYQHVRVVFAVSFLWIRVWLFTPREIVYGIQHWWLWTQSPFLEYQIFMCLAWLSSQTLLVLQLYWGALIAKGLLRLVVSSSSGGGGGDAGDKKDDDDDDKKQQ